MKTLHSQRLNETSQSVGIGSVILDDNNEIGLLREDATTTRMPIRGTSETDDARASNPSIERATYEPFATRGNAVFRVLLIQDKPLG